MDMCSALAQVWYWGPFLSYSVHAWLLERGRYLYSPWIVVNEYLVLCILSLLLFEYYPSHYDFPHCHIHFDEKKKHP